MTPIEPFGNADNMLEDLGMFEAATHAPAVTLPPVNVSSILLALDHSNQDDAARTLAASLAKTLEATVVEKTDLTTAQQVVDVLRAAGAQLLVLPVPFHSDIGQLREESLGEIVDHLLQSADVPILAVRQPVSEENLRSALRRIVVPLSPAESRTALALSWACRLLRAGGDLYAHEIADRDVIDGANLLRDATDNPESQPQADIERVLTRQFAGLVAVVQRTAHEVGFGAHVHSASGRFVAQTLEVVAAAPSLVIVGGSSDRRSTTFHRCMDLILGSTYPVLVV